MKKRRFISVAVIILLSLFSAVDAANMDISPVRIFLDGKSRIEKITIKNQHDNLLNVQVNVFKWQQNETGADVFEETKDIIVVPKILALKKGEERIIRIGANILPAAKEGTYRIYIEEIPTPEENRTGANVRLFMRIGVPVFLSPDKRIEKITMEDATFRDNKLSFRVVNAGNHHFIINSVQVKWKDREGKPVSSQQLGGWYLLASCSRLYELAIPDGIRGVLANIEIEVKTNGNGGSIVKEIAL
ncbi:MAG: fimbria/pilus periplasmic chaperone [Smithellaceae bacterium]|nr:fimbria/pilus periplasmic chaperone [Smithellaceae bacterium]